jgi:predicted HTH domain antitoxin
MMQTVAVKLDLPEDAVSFFGVEEQDLGRAILERCACKMYEEGQISLAQGKEMLGLEGITDFMDVLAAHNTPVIDYDLDDFKRERFTKNLDTRGFKFNRDEANER